MGIEYGGINLIEFASVSPSINAVDKQSVRKDGWSLLRVQVDSGAIDHVAPVSTAVGVKMHETIASRSGRCYSAANGSAIKNFGEKKLSGYTLDGAPFSMSVQCADVKRTLGSVYRLNQSGNVVVLDGKDSYMVNKKTGTRIPIKEETGQFAIYVWIKDPDSQVAAVSQFSSTAASSMNTQVSASTVSVPKVKIHNKFSMLPVSGEEGFVRQDDLF
jgi:predicted ribosome-associated RNA-binding protein Tma20